LSSGFAAIRHRLGAARFAASLVGLEFRRRRVTDRSHERLLRDGWRYYEQHIVSDPQPTAANARSLEQQLRPNCRMRGSSDEVMRPNWADATLLFGALKLTLLKMLKNSARNCTSIRSRIRVPFSSAT
jgi:hypothetical protein